MPDMESNSKAFVPEREYGEELPSRKDPLTEELIARLDKAASQFRAASVAPLDEVKSTPLVMINVERAKHDFATVCNQNSIDSAMGIPDFMLGEMIWTILQTIKHTNEATSRWKAITPKGD